VRLRKKAARGQSKVFGIGEPVDLTYKCDWLGNDAALLAKPPKALLDALNAAERPAIILGMAALKVPGVLAAAQALGAKVKLLRDGWNGWNVLHNAAARVGALDLGLTADGVEAILADKTLKAAFLLGVDEIDTSALKDVFTVYVGTHGDHGVRHADVILPGAAYTEKPGTWVNMEGRAQRGLRAVFPPGEAREDWTIFRALSAVLGHALPYDDIAGLRARIAAEWPHLAGGETPATKISAPAADAPRPQGGFVPAFGSYYLTNPIARASETMAACVAEISAPLADAAE
jgi:NADH-quinone oxidoreductase subunit G